MINLSTTTTFNISFFYNRKKNGMLSRFFSPIQSKQVQSISTPISLIGFCCFCFFPLNSNSDQKTRQKQKTRWPRFPIIIIQSVVIVHINRSINQSIDVINDMTTIMIMSLIKNCQIESKNSKNEISQRLNDTNPINQSNEILSF